jgi:glucose/arabinose dehydrogenase
MRVRWLLLLGAAAACTEHLPRAFGDAPAPAPATDGGPSPDAAVVDAQAGDDDDDDGGRDAGEDAHAPCTEPDGGGPPAIELEPINTALTAPTEVVEHAGRLHVLEQGGRVLRVTDDGDVAVMLDVSSQIVSGGESGLLGLAFHPKFAQNGFVFLYYTIPYPTNPAPSGFVFESLLVRYHSSDNGLTLDPASAHPILTLDQPYSNHNGGTLAFGNDGFLYWGLGDGGSGGDPQGNGQNTHKLLGKILRLDIDAADPYAIPATNPFSDGINGAKEVYAYGLRNPYRWRFDRPTGDLWVGDVGQGAREEIDKVILGGNYGWNIREGKSCYNATTCSTSGLIDPIVDHDRSEATTIIGGVVYRGAGIPALTGRYVYGDFGRKVYYTIPTDDPAPIPTKILTSETQVLPSSFSLDATGEIVVTDYTGGLYRMVAAKACP